MMDLLLMVAAAAAAVAALVLIAAYICYRMAFYSPKRKPNPDGGIDLPQGEQYRPYWEKMLRWAEETRALPQRELSVRSFDGLTLRGTYYEYAPDAPIELMFHGYRGSTQRDLAGGVQRCFKLGHSALLVDQRAHGRSEGKTITFGVYEHRDCLSWLKLMLQEFGPDVKIILTGISMGAATVMMAAGRPLPKQVVGVLADCGYTSPKEIICEVIGKMGLPPAVVYPFVKLGARVFGGFDPDSWSAREAMAQCKVPVIFFHGQADHFVPCHMSQSNYEACTGVKQLVIMETAGHGLCYPVEPQRYLAEAKKFWAENHGNDEK